jgi:phosphohistidine phosphatase SixA
MIKNPVVVLLFSAFVFFVQCFTVAKADTTEEWLWDALRSKNHFALLRHALAPGTGDPPEFTLGRRETQRNLSEEGRAQAKRIGDLFRAHGINKALVFSSEWYRCQDTAELLDIGPVVTLPALNSFFQNFAQKDIKTESLKVWLSQQEIDKPLVLVTHQVNITALTEIYPSSGEIVVVKKDAHVGLKVLGSIKNY